MSAIQSQTGSNPYAAQIQTLEQSAGNNPQYDQQLQQWLQQMQQSGQDSQDSNTGGENPSVQSADSANAVNGTGGSAEAGDSLSGQSQTAQSGDSNSSQLIQKIESLLSSLTGSDNGSQGTNNAAGAGSVGEANGGSSNSNGGGSNGGGAGSTTATAQSSTQAASGGSGSAAGASTGNSSGGSQTATPSTTVSSGSGSGSAAGGNSSGGSQTAASSTTTSSGSGSGSAANGLGSDLKQGQVGDCVGVSSLKAFSSTPQGQDILNKSVSQNTDGSYSVKFAGDPNQTYNVSKSDAEQFGTGDDKAAAVIGALYQHFGQSPSSGSLPTDQSMELLAGNSGTHNKYEDSTSSPQDIENTLKQLAPDAGKDEAVVFGGKPDSNGAYSQGDGHAFAIQNINEQNGTISYTNPWDDNQERTMSISDFANQASGTTADIESQSFS